MSACLGINCFQALKSARAPNHGSICYRCSKLRTISVRFVFIMLIFFWRSLIILFIVRSVERIISAPLLCLESTFPCGFLSCNRARRNRSHHTISLDVFYNYIVFVAIIELVSSFSYLVLRDLCSFRHDISNLFKSGKHS